MRKRLATVGYHGRSVEEVVRLAHEALGDFAPQPDAKNGRAICFVDVRRNPTSRDPRWRCERIRGALARLGCIYSVPRGRENTAALGNAGDTAEWVKIDEGHAKATVSSLAAMIRNDDLPLVLLCLERDPARCHRTAVAAAIAALVPGLEVVHVPAEAPAPEP